MKKILIGFFIIIILSVVVWRLVQPNDLQIIFLNVGQGDAGLIITPDRQVVLIDGGPGRVVLSKLGQHLPITKRTIDLVVLTHPHADHLSGLLEVVKRYEVRLIVWTGVIHTSPEYLAWLKVIKQKNIPVKVVKGGQNINLGEVKLQIVWPRQNLAGKVVEDLNASSLVIRLVYGRSNVLWTGDINQSEELEILSSGQPIQSQIIKIAHQGSASSSSLAWLKAVKPIWAIISVGHNNYGHPHKIVLDRLGHLLIKILRTDKQGDIKFLSNGENWHLSKPGLLFLTGMLP
ncbi:MAG: ComEC/Rec2 family competence protein [Patescibacteria group bacterium]